MALPRPRVRSGHRTAWRSITAATIVGHATAREDVSVRLVLTGES